MEAEWCKNEKTGMSLSFEIWKKKEQIPKMMIFAKKGICSKNGQNGDESIVCVG
jgi:hypothetical protein